MVISGRVRENFSRVLIFAHREKWTISQDFLFDDDGFSPSRESKRDFPTFVRIEMHAYEVIHKKKFNSKSKKMMRALRVGIN